MTQQIKVIKINKDAAIISEQEQDVVLRTLVEQKVIDALDREAFLSLLVKEEIGATNIPSLILRRLCEWELIYPVVAGAILPKVGGASKKKKEAPAETATKASDWRSDIQKVTAESLTEIRVNLSKKCPYFYVGDSRKWLAAARQELRVVGMVWRHNKLRKLNTADAIKMSPELKSFEGSWSTYYSLQREFLTGPFKSYVGGFPKIVWFEGNADMLPAIWSQILAINSYYSSTASFRLLDAVFAEVASHYFHQIYSARNEDIVEKEIVAFEPTADMKKLIDEFEVDAKYYEGVLINLVNENNLINFQRALLGLPYTIWKPLTINRETTNWDEELKELRMRTLFMKKFGKLPHLKRGEKILDKIDAKQKQVILLEYSRIQDLIEQNRKNKCEHLKLSRQLGAASNIKDLYRIFTMLVKLAKNPAEKAKFIDCKVCSLSLMCPHIKTMYEMNMAGKNNLEVRHQLLKYSAEVPVSNAFYCKICGEELARVDEEDSFINHDDAQRRNLVSMEEQTRKAIFDEVLNVVRIYVTFRNKDGTFWSPTAKQLFRFCGDVTSEIYNPIHDIELQLNKSKTMSDASLALRVRFHTIIFVWAWITKWATSPDLKSKGMTLELKEYAGKIKKRDIPSYLEQAEKLIEYGETVLLSKINDQSLSSGILKFLQAAFQRLSQPHVKLEEKKTAADLVLDPGLAFTITAHRLDKLKSGASPKSLPDLDQVQYYLGLLKAKNSVEAEKWMPRFKWKTVNNELLDLSSAMFVQIFRYFAEFLRMESTPVYQGNHLAPEHVEHNKKLDALNEFEKGLIIVRRLNASKGQSNRNYTKDNRYKAKPFNLSQIYGVDEKAVKIHQHKWSLYIFNGQAYSASDIVQWSPEEREGKVLEDRECSVCHEKFSETDKKDPEVVLAIFNEVQTQQNFFNYYQYRCPEGPGSTHDLVGDNCKKCGIDINENRGSPKMVAYYNKYKKTFLSLHQMKSFEVPQPIEPAVPSAKSGTTVDSCIKLAQTIIEKMKLNKKPNVILNLGASEKIIHSDIENNIIDKEMNADGTTAPQGSAQRYHIFDKLKEYYMDFIIQYNLLKNYNEVAFHSEETKELIKGREKELAGFDSNIQLPSVGSYYALLRSFLELLISLDKNSLLRDFAKEQITKYIRLDEENAKPKDINLISKDLIAARKEVDKAYSAADREEAEGEIDIRDNEDPSLDRIDMDQSTFEDNEVKVDF
ncbi:hypothetical protein BNJ_00123 [Kaumoebavirus]|uniref:hypothetical protein n=1 Tax=Kaumoebavirus TaxID=1859492 RepID=UPI0009C1D3E3|nr:hypothetical protein BNJ_00123 [Kaumoebavirus]ARA71956.1 hypothetical protein BNJ_00123 [Kaumoebavirus]